MKNRGCANPRCEKTGACGHEPAHLGKSDAVLSKGHRDRNALNCQRWLSNDAIKRRVALALRAGTAVTAIAASHARPAATRRGRHISAAVTSTRDRSPVGRTSTTGGSRAPAAPLTERRCVLGDDGCSDQGEREQNEHTHSGPSQYARGVQPMWPQGKDHPGRRSVCNCRALLTRSAVFPRCLLLGLGYPLCCGIFHSTGWCIRRRMKRFCGMIPQNLFDFRGVLKPQKARSSALFSKSSSQVAEAGFEPATHRL